jgi:hypothetical protein
MCYWYWSTEALLRFTQNIEKGKPMLWDAVQNGNIVVTVGICSYISVKIKGLVSTVQ